MPRVKNVTFNVGDIVFMSSKQENKGQSTKLQPRRVGPYPTYRVKSLISKGKASRINTTAHVSQL